MKKFKITIVLLIIFCGCKFERHDAIITPANKTAETITQHEYGVPLYIVVVIDSCEYLITQYYNANAALTHKGNCKYCKERSKK